eukprot:CAMPEP_0178991938 /NCGR_PEP_ID=MMETSP0795-20121207/5821_1 /TAXON_ID=88552 /ORGANISM="Amoebophrya sp., Strain Ameob2" /LENGTH=281 /DNA_ID=CAMNT_0020683733 /DNA_START=161 /DNA_END=1006 /DNA_ORIENTATION=+
MGAQNMKQECRNAENINETFRKNETEGYFKPPFCQWPFGGASKKETKHRIKSGEPVVKAGSDEFGPPGNDFYFGMGKFTRPKDDDEMSIRTESTTLYMQSNLCTRTFGPHKKPKRLPGICERAQFERRPQIKSYNVPDSMKNYDAKVDIWDNVHHDGVRQPTLGREASSTEFISEESNSRIFEKKAGPQDEVKPSPAQPPVSSPVPLRSGKTGLPRSYQVGTVPRVSDGVLEENEPSWRKTDNKVLISPRTYLNATANVAGKKKVVRDLLFEPNDQVLSYD